MVRMIRALPGIFTPEKVRTNVKRSFSHSQGPQDLTGKEVLGIGTWDGPIAFEAEARGTIGLIQDPSRTGFNVGFEAAHNMVFDKFDSGAGPASRRRTSISPGQSIAWIPLVAAIWLTQIYTGWAPLTLSIPPQKFF